MDAVRSDMHQTYILLAQRDHDVTVRIADATQKDAAAQKQIAERTYRDSANMKAMTLINLCCLPGILAAVSELYKKRVPVPFAKKDQDIL